MCVIYLLFLRPTPQVDWEKVGGDLPKGRETRENYGKTLKIENVSYGDKGTYRCTASNSLGAASHAFHVTVEGTVPTPSGFVSFSFKKWEPMHAGAPTPGRVRTGKPLPGGPGLYRAPLIHFVTHPQSHTEGTHDKEKARVRDEAQMAPPIHAGGH